VARSSVRKAEAALLRYALSLPGAREDHPWGECVVKVGAKIFVFFGRGEDGKGFGMSVKLPTSCDLALTFPFTRPTGYGLGKHGWVSARFVRTDAPPVDLLREWIEESYRAVAPKKLVAKLASASAKPPGPRTRKVPTRR
jgi:predicted DNA-binding protein (MmcQ/YjbR family)